MANVLRFMRPQVAPPRNRMPSFVAGLDDEDEETRENEHVAAPANLSGRTERDVVPIEDVEPEGDAEQSFQLQAPDMRPEPEQPNDFSLRLPGDLAADQQRLRPPMTSGSRRLSYVDGLDDDAEEAEEAPPNVMPTQTPIDRDAGDRRQATRADRTQAVANLFGRIAQLARPRGSQIDFSQSPTGDTRWGDPARARIAERHATMDGTQGAKVEGAREQEAADYTRATNERRLDLDERRIAQTEAATEQRLGYRDADIDPAHANAANERRLYASAFAALPEHIRSTFPGYDPSNPQVAQVLDGLGAAQVRRNLDLLQDQLDTRFPDEADWRNTTRTGGGRAPRNGLAGLSGGGGRTIHRGDAGLTADQLLEMDNAGVDEIAVEDAPAAPMPRGRPGGAARAPRPQPTAAPQGPQAAAPQGRPLLDRPMTPQELDAATPQVRRTQLLARAEQRRHLGVPWRDAVATVEGLQPAERDRLMSEWGSEGTDRIPGWQRVRDTGALTPARLTEMREATTMTAQVRAGSRHILELASQIDALNLAEDQLVGHPLVAQWRSEARRIQTALRVLDRTGVPTGNEQERAMEEAPEPNSVNGVRSLLRSRATYGTLPDTLGRNVGIYMQQNGYAPVRRQGGPQR